MSNQTMTPEQKVTELERQVRLLEMELKIVSTQRDEWMRKCLSKEDAESQAHAELRGDWNELEDTYCRLLAEHKRQQEDWNELVDAYCNLRAENAKLKAAAEPAAEAAEA